MWRLHSVIRKAVKASSFCGVERTVLVTYNENLFVAQARTLLREIAKRQRYLRELQQQLQRWQRGKLRRGKPPSVAGVSKKVQGWLQLQKTLLGKTLLFTDNDGWSDAQIVRGYRALHHVESGFRCMKDPHHIYLRPQHHWTDQKIEVHVVTSPLPLGQAA